MKIGFIGGGSVAGSLANLLQAGGHDVAVGLRDEREKRADATVIRQSPDSSDLKIENQSQVAMSLFIAAERELSAFFKVVNILFGPEQAYKSAVH